MKKVHLVALMSGVGKAGKPWYRVILKSSSDRGPVVQEHWLDETVGRSAVQAGLIDDCDVLVDCSLDAYLRPAISAICPVDEVLID